MRRRCPCTAASRRETRRSTPRNRAKSRWPSWRGEPGSPWSGGLRLIGVHREPLAGRERDGQRLVAAERDELPADTVETHHLAEVNVDAPDVQRKPPAREARPERRTGETVRALNDGITSAVREEQAGTGEAPLTQQTPKKQEERTVGE